MKDDDIVKVDLLDVLLNENNMAPIIMYDESGKQLEFEQVAVIPYGKDDLYCVLKPITKIKGIGENEAVVFRVEDNDGEAVLTLEEDELKAIDIFNEYYNMLEEANNKKTKRRKQ